MIQPRSRSAVPHRQRILITGASSGIGAQLARVWAADGRDLVLCARRTDDLDALRDSLIAADPERRIVVKTLDVNDREAVRRVFAESIEELGGLDRVVVNAGIGSGEPIGTGSGDANYVTAQTNFVGALNQAEAALAHFRAVGDGHLVFIASMAAIRGLRGRITVYAATKAALASLGEGLRSELWNSPIEVTTIFPGYVKTALTDAAPDTPRPAPLVSSVAEMVRAIDAERPKAYVPSRPWSALSLLMRAVPLGVLRRFGG